MSLGRWWRGSSLVWVAVAGDQRQPPGPGVQAHSAKDTPDAMLGDPQPAPLLAGELGRDPPGPEPGVRQRERDDPLLQVRADLIRHPRPPPLPHVQRLKAPAVDLALPSVIRRA